MAMLLLQTPSHLINADSRNLREKLNFVKLTKKLRFSAKVRNDFIGTFLHAKSELSLQQFLEDFLLKRGKSIP